MWKAAKRNYHLWKKYEKYHRTKQGIQNTTSTIVFYSFRNTLGTLGNGCVKQIKTELYKYVCSNVFCLNSIEGPFNNLEYDLCFKERENILLFWFGHTVVNVSEF